MHSARPLTILTVDDSEIVFKLLSVVFTENKNFNWLGHAYTLEEAHSFLREKEPQVVILDIHIKESTSFGLLEYINKHYPDISTIMFSNVSSEPYRAKCKELGAAYFIDKSTEMEKLSGILKSLSVSR
ncbi:MAG: response regulator [Bacteroidia bacterium]